MAYRKTLDEKIAAAKLEAAQKEARVKELLQQQKTAERKARNHRFCLRGGKLEKLFPELALLTEEQFEIFVEKCLLNDNTRAVLAELAPPEPVAVDGGSDTMQSGESTVAQTINAEAHTDTTPAPKLEGTTHNPGANNNKPTHHNNGNNNHKPTQAGTQHSGNANGRPAEATRVAG